jgi:hypothetical protein
MAVGGLAQAEQGSRWPMLCETFGKDVGSFVLHAYPMRPSSIVLGVLSTYQTHDSGLPIPEDEVQFLANAVGVVILGEFDSNHLVDAGYGQQPWGDRDRVAAATGMVVAQLRISPVDAMAVLRAHAFASDTTLLDVSKQVVARSLVFHEPGGDR